MARRNEHSLSEIKAMVLNAAETIIMEEGFAALTIRKIAMEMGYTVGSIYMVFASRAELILHLNARTLEDISTRLQAISITADIETWLNAYLQYIRTNPERWRMIFTHESKPLPDWYQAQLDSVFLQFSAYFILTTPEQKQTVYALWQGIQGICLLSPDTTHSEASVQLLLKTFLHGWQV